MRDGGLIALAAMEMSWLIALTRPHYQGSKGRIWTNGGSLKLWRKHPTVNSHCAQWRCSAVHLESVIAPSFDALPVRFKSVGARRLKGRWGRRMNGGSRVWAD
ncbi:hypothetical protein SKAU_G00326980 [Synaphobranchus kaupii]|uniref:Uncharacterized protein n=1 Tax=Synaphobranchus kaupii TaxID=118154 RepID=A0A9Q1EPS2_SYNKA|nr:hypothetical protein SKAU_G00326980 [Synaphobranchus kaupii]